MDRRSITAAMIFDAIISVITLGFRLN
jgi:hypothetical protein